MRKLVLFVIIVHRRSTASRKKHALYTDSYPIRGAILRE